MSKSPEEYFAEQSFSAHAPSQQSGLTSAEKAFMDKYLGVNEGEILQQIGLANTQSVLNFTSAAHYEKTSDHGEHEEKVQEVPCDSCKGEEAAPDSQDFCQKAHQEPAGQEELPSSDQQAEVSSGAPLEEELRKASELLMVGFFIGEQEFTIPTVAVQEVIRSTSVTRLPTAPSFVAGVISLRGKVTPLVYLRNMLEMGESRPGDDRFIIVCRRQGLQVGLLIERVHTMYRVKQEDIDWNIEAHLGINVELVSGLLKIGDKLVGIVSVDRIIASILT